MNAAIKIDKRRLAALARKPLRYGGHAKSSEGLCVMEAVAYVAREPHSDRPQCASRVLSAFMRKWNDTLKTDGQREALKPLVVELVGTAASDEIERLRLVEIAKWMIDLTARWFELSPTLGPRAAKLRAIDASRVAAAAADAAAYAADAAADAAAAADAYAAADAADAAAAAADAYAAADAAAYESFWRLGSAMRAAARHAAYAKLPWREFVAAREAEKIELVRRCCGIGREVQQ